MAFDSLFIAYTLVAPVRDVEQPLFVHAIRSLISSLFRYMNLPARGTSANVSGLIARIR